VTILTAACVTVDQEREDVALRYARDVAGILLEDRVDAILEPVGAR
jgi:hypothetical protein